MKVRKIKKTIGFRRHTFLPFFCAGVIVMYRKLR